MSNFSFFLVLLAFLPASPCRRYFCYFQLFGCKYFWSSFDWWWLEISCNIWWHFLVSFYLLNDARNFQMVNFSLLMVLVTELSLLQILICIMLIAPAIWRSVKFVKKWSQKSMPRNISWTPMHRYVSFDVFSLFSNIWCFNNFFLPFTFCPIMMRLSVHCLNFKWLKLNLLVKNKLWGAGISFTKGVWKI